MKLAIVSIVGGFLVLGLVGAAAADIVDYGEGVRWDTRELETAWAAMGPARFAPGRTPDAGEVVEYGDGIRWDTTALKRAAETFAPGPAVQIPHELDGRMHASQ